MGHAMDSSWYATVLSACHLDLDLQQLPEGDMTQLADRGSNMSGDRIPSQAAPHAAIYTVFAWKVSSRYSIYCSIVSV